jgi:FkbM family methyltransferase
MKIAGKIAAGAGRMLCRMRGGRFGDAIERLCDRFHRALDNVDFEIERNGERRVLEIVSAATPGCLFDVGANSGDWTKLARSLNPAARIHAFEIVPSTRAHLVTATGGLGGIVVADHGLSDAEGVVDVRMGTHSAMATVFPIEGMEAHASYYDHVVSCRVRRADTYMEAQGLETVDFVKIDAEGMDLRVIRGFGDRLRDVRAIQFEYGIFNIASHDLLADFCRHLAAHGFVVGKVFPRRVRFFDYHFDLENFHGSNYVAVRGGERELIEGLRRGRPV